jgi:hypothetical protein
MGFTHAPAARATVGTRNVTPGQVRAEAMRTATQLR